MADDDNGIHVHLEPPPLPREAEVVIGLHEDLDERLQAPASERTGRQAPWTVQPPVITEVPDEIGQGEMLVVLGERLDGIDHAAFDGVPAVVDRATHSGKRLRVIVPDTIRGLKTLWISGPNGQAYSHCPIRVTEPDDDGYPTAT
jgi:hypothetical protein